jgi:spectinomycin phosphotransferase
MLYGELLADNFGIRPKDVYEVKGGWSAKAFRVTAENGEYFLKVYDKTRPSTQPWVERIDAYIPVLGWLSRTQELCGRIVEPIPSLHGYYKVEADEHVFLLFGYVPGETPGQQGLSRLQVAELAETLALLHGFGEGIPCDTRGLSEDISLSFCAKLELYLTEAHNTNMLSELVCPEIDMIRAAIAETIRLRDTARLNAKSLVLCHTDAHHNNVIQSDRLVLVDWEDLRLAPAEADLFMYVLNPYWNEFWHAYAAVRQGFLINADLMHFYLIRRRLDDIWYYVCRVLFDGPNKDEVIRICDRLKSAFSETRRLLSENKF